MAKAQVSFSDSAWGELTSYEVRDGEKEEFIHRFDAPDDAEYAVVVTVDGAAEVVVSARDAGLEPVMTRERARVYERVRGPVIALIRVFGSARIELGFFKRLGKQAREKGSALFHRAVKRFANECAACQALVRFAISFATGGADLAGEALDHALEEAAEQIAKVLGDSLFDEVLSILRSMVNPGRLAAKEVCRRLGYCP
jgi:hypothetical protein